MPADKPGYRPGGPFVKNQQRNELVVANLPLVGYLVSDMCAKNTHLSREDLTSVGSIALITAADSYDPTFGVPFGAYARRRILGAMADDMRAADWAGRGYRQKIKEAKTAEETLTGALGRRPTSAEIAEVMGISEKGASAALRDASRQVVALDHDMQDYLVAESQTPEQETLAQEQDQMLRTAVDALPERMRLIVTKLFFEDSTVKEIAAELGVSHGAVSQQRSEAMKLLREGLGQHYAMTPQPSEQENAVVAGGRRQAQYLAALAERARGGITAGAASLRARPAA